MSTYPNRRHFIKISSLASLGLLLGGCANSAHSQSASVENTRRTAEKNGPQPYTPKFEVIIIGAGAAGLGAARLLHDEGYQVVILEARERIGGRVWTSRVWPGIPLDLGASWIHGIKGNPLTELARQFQVKTTPTDYDNIITYNAVGRALSDAEWDKLERNLAAILEESAKTGENLEQDMSLGEALDEAIADLKLAEEEQRWLYYAVNTTIEHEFAADAAKLSLFNWDEGKVFEGGDVILPDGYDQILDGLAQGLDIRLSHLVSQIEYGNEGVRISTGREIFEADYALITLPLGVLQKNVVKFVPPLPARKVQAAGNLGMGLLNKVYLRFPEVFWDAESDLIGYIAPNKGEWGEWLNLYKFTGQPILLAFNAGTYARVLEPLADETIVDRAMQVLRAIYGTDVPYPAAWLITRWASDPLAGGSYSYSPPGATPADRAALAEPVANRLFFAGEATSQDYPATVHGALLSGQAAAQRIIDL